MRPKFFQSCQCLSPFLVGVSECLANRWRPFLRRELLFERDDGSVVPVERRFGLAVVGTQVAEVVTGRGQAEGEFHFLRVSFFQRLPSGQGFLKGFLGLSALFTALVEEAEVVITPRHIGTVVRDRGAVAGQLHLDTQRILIRFLGLDGLRAAPVDVSHAEVSLGQPALVSRYLRVVARQLLPDVERLAARQLESRRLL